METSQITSQLKVDTNPFDKEVENLLFWKNKNSYFYSQLTDFYKFLISPEERVVEIGFSTGDMLTALKSTEPLVIVSDPVVIQYIKEFHASIKTYHADIGDLQAINKIEPKNFDYVVAHGLLSGSSDVQVSLRGIKSLCSSQTRVVVSTYNAFWEPLLKLGSKIRLRSKSPVQNWLSDTDLGNLFFLEDFEVISKYNRILLPKYVPILSWFANKILIHMPLLESLCLMNFYVLRKRAERSKPLSVSIIIPARNEAGNIENALKRLPPFGSHQQIIFIEGHSTDETWNEIERVRKLYSTKEILSFRQTGKGKGDAVRLGFEKATGDILFILDADLTVPPEDLPKFYEAIEDGKGEFINGTRLVYPMEKQAMRFLNLLGNKFFAWAFSWLLSQKFRDTLCGTKVLRKNHYSKIAANRAYFGDFDPFGDFDLLFGAAKQNLKIIEIPIRYKERTYGDTNISRFTHGWLLLKMCLYAAKKIKFR